MSKNQEKVYLDKDKFHFQTQDYYGMDGNSDSGSNTSLFSQKLKNRSLSEDNSKEKNSMSANSNESGTSNGPIGLNRKTFVVNKPNVKRFRKVFGVWLSKFLIPLYKIILNPNDHFKKETKEKILILKKLIEEILQIQKIEFFLNSTSFEFDKDVSSLVFSILNDKFETLKEKELEISLQKKKQIILKNYDDNLVAKNKTSINSVKFLEDR
jgi:hypothetical protein